MAHFVSGRDGWLLKRALYGEPESDDNEDNTMEYYGEDSKEYYEEDTQEYYGEGTKEYYGEDTNEYYGEETHYGNNDCYTENCYREDTIKKDDSDKDSGNLQCSFSPQAVCERSFQQGLFEK